MKRKIITVFLLLIELFTIAACSGKIKFEDDSVNNPNQLNIFRADYKLTQEQALSRVKAEYLIKNKGYKDSDEIVTILKLTDDSLLEKYLDKYINHSTSISEYISSNSGIAESKRLSTIQNQLIDTLKTKGLIEKVEYQYTTVMNAIAVKTTYGNLEKLSKIQGIESTILSDTYNKPASTKSTENAVENVVDVYETGIFDSSSVTYTGNNTSVAVLDSGFDCSHEVFANQPEKPMFKIKDILNVLDKTNASKTTRNIEITDVYYSSKIPFIYDYADKDTDVFPYDSEHGTHVAGIIGGKSDTITGVATNTQLVLMKVFPDLDAGADTDDILAALEDAMVIGVDAINMSLGSSCGFSREVDKVEINKVYDALKETGISVITAASNSYSSAFGGAQGNTNFVTNPDSGTVGSPSTYEGCLSVASISGVKSKYMVANGEDIIFFDESNAVTGKPNDFFKELGIDATGKKQTYEYVTIPGIGSKINFNSLGDKVKGKIALVRRGDITFEEKAQNAKNAGAVGCIIYNNIEGSILMSMGKSDHIPTISISKDYGTLLAQYDTGTLLVDYDNQAGPFMSDFSSWGPTPSLGLKPEITAHGGDITSAIPGGGYDQLSGTSMATPNLCGIVVLIKQYIKDTYPTLNAKEIEVLTNQLLMSTATIALNEEGNPYSPRKQGAGLASLKNAVNTKAYITVDGIDRTKLELGDDKDRTGVYKMTFNVVNLSNTTVEYTLDTVGMTETVSKYEEKFVSEKSQILKGKQKVKLVEESNDVSLNDTTLTINANKTAKIEVTYTLSNSDKSLIDELFPYGMYVEGFVKLTAKEEDDVDLNIPFLAFYGDWTEAPMFDKTYYEVDPEEKDASINDEDKLKADYYATTPYGSYFYNYIIPLGTYLYDIDESVYDVIPASEEHIAISNVLGAIDGIGTVYGGLLRGAKRMDFAIKDKITGEIVWETTDYNCNKAYSNGGSPVPYYNNLDISSYLLGLVNNREYEFTMNGVLDYGDGGVTTNVRNSFEFDFTFDNQAPIIKSATYEKEYDKVTKKDRYYITLVVYDNHYVQSIQPAIFTSSSTYTTLEANPIPVYSEKGTDNTVRFEITSYLKDLYEDQLVTNALAFIVDDYALNANLYICELPGTKGEFRFTEDGTWDGKVLNMISVEEGETLNLVDYLATLDETIDENKDYLCHLNWTTKNESIVSVKEGIVVGLKKGRGTVTVSELVTGQNAAIIINVKAKSNIKNNPKKASSKIKVDEAEIDDLRFSYFDTVAAFARGGQISVIGEAGSRVFLSNVESLNFYPGEKIRLGYDFDPWYAESNYELSFKSSNPNVATVDETGLVEGMAKGTTYITLKVEGSSIQARVRITINDPFVIENRTLMAYKGRGGDVVIPDDEGILYISSFAFCLYITDQDVKVDEDDWDKNKIPQTNDTIKSVVIPEGVEEIQKYAFYNCTKLESVTIPSSVKYIREFAFDNNQNLKTINFNNTQTIGRAAFRNCKLLNNIDLSKVFAIGVSAFEGCTSLDTVNLQALRNTGERAFKDCTALTSVTLTENTKLAKAMFVNSGLVSVDIYETIQIPEFCFANSTSLETVNIHNDIVSINEGAFSECTNLKEVNILKSINLIANQAFYSATSLKQFTLPNCEFTLGNYAFYKCSDLETLIFNENTKLNFGGDVIQNTGSIFSETKLTNFTLNGNKNYTTDGIYLTNQDKNEIILAPITTEYGDLVLDSKYDTIGVAAFAGTNIKSLTVNHNVTIKDYAFSDSKIETINFADTLTSISIGEYAFYQANSLTAINNSELITEIKDYAFAFSTIKNFAIGANLQVGDGAFFNSKIETVTIGENTTIGGGAFRNCSELTTVEILGEGNVHFGVVCFGYAKKLKTINLEKVDERIEDETFYGCTSLTEANLQNVKYIGNYAFGDCQNLRTIKVPNVEEIGDGAFGRNSETGKAPSFGEIILPNTLKTLGAGAFLGCEGITEIIIPEGITEIKDFTFAYCSNLAEVTLPESITVLGQYAFSACQKLTEINLDKITIFGVYSLGGTTALEDADISNAKFIGAYSFVNSAINKDLVLNSVKYIGEYAFSNTQIKSFTSSSIVKIGEAAFEYCQELTTVSLSDRISDTLELSEDEKEIVTSKINSQDVAIDLYKAKGLDILIFDECPLLEKITVNGNENGIINDYGFVENGVLYRNLINGTYELKAIPAALNEETFTVKEGTTRIDDFSGNNNKNIKTLILPDSLKIIGNYAFYNYENLTMVEFKSVNAPALEDSYNSRLALDESDPGYDLAHKYTSLFGLEIYYCTFIDLAGKKEPISMTIPLNANDDSYATIVYELFFGNISKANRSTYTAKEQALKDFVEYAEKIMEIQTITIANEKIVSLAIDSYSKIKQNPVDFGINETTWNNMVKVVTEANETIRQIKLSKADQKVRDLQDLIDSLPVVPEEQTIKTLKPLLDFKTTTTEIGSSLNKLKANERSIIDITKYNELLTAYAVYEQLVANQEEPTNPQKPTSNKKGCKCSCGAALGFVVTILAATTIVMVIRKKEN